jgi:hypothetical protein
MPMLTVSSFLIIGNLTINENIPNRHAVWNILIYSPIQDVAPSAVRIADAIDAINCTKNFAVSFLLIFTSFLF